MYLSRALLTAFALALFAGGCAELTPPPVAYNPPALRAKNLGNVVVKVSLSKQMVYVMEGSKPLLVTACSVGLPQKPTPKGKFTVIEKILKKRSGAYGFYVRGDEIVGAAANNRPAGSGWRYVGYPMPYWVGFSPGYGFHEGDVWPIPRTHGCLRLHKNAAANFYSLVRIGTPVIILENQPEDLLYGARHIRPNDYTQPDPPSRLLISPDWFNTMRSPNLLDG